MKTASFSFEKILWNKGITQVCGVDEVGRGCFAGPVVAGAVIFPSNVNFSYDLADSKLLKPKVREELSVKIKEQALCWSIGVIDIEIINKVGIGKASQMAFRKALLLLKNAPEFIFIDAFYIKRQPKRIQLPIIKGDQVCGSIAAASIIAKVYRDDLMNKLSNMYPGYNFGKNKGYGTLDHRKAITKLGLSKLHRKSFDLGKYVEEIPI